MVAGSVLVRLKPGRLPMEIASSAGRVVVFNRPISIDECGFILMDPVDTPASKSNMRRNAQAIGPPSLTTMFFTSTWRYRYVRRFEGGLGCWPARLEWPRKKQIAKPTRIIETLWETVSCYDPQLNGLLEVQDIACSRNVRIASLGKTALR